MERLQAEDAHLTVHADSVDDDLVPAVEQGFVTQVLPSLYLNLRHKPLTSSVVVNKRQCPVCGTSSGPTSLIFDERFWKMQATLDEIKESASDCTWCSVLQQLIYICIPPKYQVANGVLDWGRQQLAPRWYIGATFLQCDISCILGEQSCIERF